VAEGDSDGDEPKVKLALGVFDGVTDAVADGVGVEENAAANVEATPLISVGDSA